MQNDILLQGRGRGLVCFEILLDKIENMCYNKVNIDFDFVNLYNFFLNQAVYLSAKNVEMFLAF